MLRELITINPRATYQSNPRRKRKSGGKKHRATYRRNPRWLPSAKDIGATVLPAVIGGAGALALDVGIGQLTMIPEDWKTGFKRTLLRAGAALAAGFAARRFAPAKYKPYVDAAMAGALTIVAYDNIKGYVQANYPDLALGMYDGDLAAYERVGSYNALPALQTINSGRTVGAYVRSSGGGGDLAGMIPAVR